MFCVDIIRPSKDNLSKYNFIQSSIESLPFSENSFDFVHCLTVLQYIKNEEVVMGEFYRVLKPGGKLLLTVPTALSPFRLIRDLQVRFGVYDRYYIPQFPVEEFHYYTRNRLKKLMTYRRFMLIELCGYGYNFMPRFIGFIINLIRLDKIFHFLRLSHFVKVVKNSIVKETKDERQVKKNEDQNRIIQQHEKEIVNHSNVAERRSCFISDFSYHYIVVLQKD